MQNSKLIKMLQTLSETEIKELGKFLEGISYRKTGSVYSLYNYLKKTHPLFPEKRIEKKYVQKKLFNDKGNGEKRLLDTMSQLSLAVEEFFIKKQLELNRANKDFLLLEALKARKLDKLFFQKIATVEKSWEKEGIPGIEHLHNQYKLQRMCFLHPNYSVVKEGIIDAPDLIESIDKYYFAAKLYWTSCFVTSSNHSGKDKNEKSRYLLPEIIDLATDPHFNEVPQIKLFKELSHSLLNDQFDNYEILKTYFYKYLNLFDNYEQHDLFSFLSFCCFQNYKEGKEEALQELFDLNCFAIEHKIIIEDGFVSAEIFRNIVNLACVVKEFEWTENFIKEYQHKLKEEEKEDMTALCEATLAFYKNDFNEALSKLIQIKMQNAFYGVQIRFIQLQCYYELEDYYELFLSHSNAFIKFLNRNQNLSEGMKVGAKNFIDYLKKVKKIKEEKTAIPNILLEKIKEEKNILWKSWLLQKAEELS